MNFPRLSHETRLSRLSPPTGKVRMVLDTDIGCEVDDQFALAYALKSPEKLEVEAVYSAPFSYAGSVSPEEGVEKSYNEILHVLKLLNINKKDGFVFKGSRGYLENSTTPRESEAARDLVKRAMSRDDDLLYVAAIGAITNVASAILMKPEIINKIVVVWLGGHALNWKDTREFNLHQDIHASRIIFNSGVPLIHIPCMGVATHLTTTVPELEYYLEGKSQIGDYLTKIVRDYSGGNPVGWSKVIWDIATIGWLIDDRWFQSSIVPSPILTDQYTWSFDPQRHFIRSIYYMNRDHIFADFFKKLTE